MGFEPTTTEFRSDALTDWAIRPWVQLAPRANFVQLLQFHSLFSVTFHFGCLRSSVVTFSYWKFSVDNHMSVAEWADTYGIHHWKSIWSSYRRLCRVGFEPMTTEFRSDADALTDWDIRPGVQLALRVNFVQLLQFHRLFSVRFHFGYCSVLWCLWGMTGQIIYLSTDVSFIWVSISFLIASASFVLFSSLLLGVTSFWQLL